MSISFILHASIVELKLEKFRGVHKQKRHGTKDMMRLIITQDKPKLMELSLKQREQITAYRADRERARQQYLDEQVTWRELIKDPNTKLNLKNNRR